MNRTVLSLLILSLTAPAALADDRSDAPQAAAAAPVTRAAKRFAPPIPHDIIPVPIEERMQALGLREDADAGIPLEEQSFVPETPESVMQTVDAARASLSSAPGNPASAGEAAAGAGRAAAVLLSAPVRDPLADALIAPEPEPMDPVFLEAHQLYRQGEADGLNQMLPLFSEHELGAYPQYWALLLALRAHPDDPAVDDEFRRFIEINDGDYIAESARREYLRIRGPHLNAEDFARFYDRLVWNKTDPVIAARKAYYDLEAALSDGGSAKVTRALRSAKTIYRDSSAVSDPALRELGDLICEADRGWCWTRVVILLQKNRIAETRRVILSVPKPALPASAAELTFILDRPSAWLAANRKKLDRLHARMAVFAALRLAAVRPEDAALVAESAVDPRAGAFWRSLVWSRIGFTATTRLHPRGNEWFTRAGDALGLMPDAVVEADQIAAWRARAAIRARNWYTLNKVIDGMPKSLRDEEVWIYWRGRALAARGLNAEARACFERIAQRITFYGKLAADALGRSYGFSRPPKRLPTQAEIDAWDDNPNIIRARSLYRMHLYADGHREWNWAVRGLDDAGLLSLAAYARQNRLIHRMINTSMRTGDDNIVIEQRFPRPHKQLITVSSHAQNLPAAWVFGLIRQESRFIPAVHSAVGARGLMQIMPGTAKWMAGHLGISGYDHQNLTELELNLVLGTAYLHMLYRDLDENYALATAAYNAGPSRARAWRAAVGNSMETAAFVETIPFYETREYVKNVLANMHTYSMLTGELTETRFINQIGSVGQGLTKAAALP